MTLTIYPVADAPSIHTYFDVIPESPDGRRIVYFEFDGIPLDHGHIMIREREGDRVTRVLHCAGTAHGAAKQGWLDQDHIYFTADDQVHVATTEGKVVQKFPGAIDTISQVTRCGLAPSKNWRGKNRPDKESACYRIDIDDASVHELLDRDQAWELCQARVDLTGVDKQWMNFKHTKWAPDGRSWFVVFTNEENRKAHPDQPRVKVLIAADDQGHNARYIAPFHHHPNWSPDGKFIFAFAGNPGEIHAWDPQTGADRLLCTFPDEGHPCMHPDGQSLLTDGYANDAAAIYWHRFADGTTRELVTRFPLPRVAWQTSHPPGQVCHAHPVWSHDGQRIYFNRVVGELPQLVMVRPSEIP